MFCYMRYDKLKQNIGYKVKCVLVDIEVESIIGREILKLEEGCCLKDQSEID